MATVQASSAIPVVPLYVSLLFKVMKAKGTHEGCIEQIQRLFEKQMYNGNALDFDENGRVRIDDWEMAPDVQKAVFDAWPQVTTETFDAHADFAGYQSDFMKNFGFETLDSVTYVGTNGKMNEAAAAMT